MALFLMGLAVVLALHVIVFASGGLLGVMRTETFAPIREAARAQPALVGGLRFYFGLSVGLPVGMALSAMVLLFNSRAAAWLAGISGAISVIFGAAGLFLTPHEIVEVLAGANLPPSAFARGAEFVDPVAFLPAGVALGVVIFIDYDESH